VPPRVGAPSRVGFGHEQDRAAEIRAKRMSRIVISYRRQDSADITGRLHDHLVQRFGRENVFKDVDSIPAGADFREEIRSAVSKAAVLLAVIGDRWLNATDGEGRRRIDDPGDTVRIEIETALQCGVRLIPLLVRGTRMPAPGELPDPIRALTYCHAIAIREDPDFRHDMSRLIDAIIPGLGGAQPPTEPGAPARDATRHSRLSEESVSIAVLPFVDWSPGRDREYFCDGIAEELINALAQIEGLLVIARISAFSYKGRKLSIRDIGRELNVRTVLEGSVRWEGEKLRIIVQLIDARSECHLWSECYKCRAGDVFAIQDEIVSAVVKELRPALLPSEKGKQAARRPPNLEAHDLYLQGCYFRSKGSPGALQRAFDYLH
jgi:TolB-like protein